jgi:anti-sigma regulatory factor (Ser/Thr protein kinase)
MTEIINLEVPATLSALSTVRMVLGGLGARLDFSIDDIEDVYLATGELLRAAFELDSVDRLLVEVALGADNLRITMGAFASVELREGVTKHDEHCLDLCMLLRNTVDDVSLEELDNGFRVVLQKARGEEPS